MGEHSYIEKAQASDRELRKALGVFEIMFLVLGAVIGSGWLFGSYYAAATAGPAAVLSWIIAGILMLFVALVFAELAGAIPRSGAIVRYPQYSHGSFASTLLGWAYLLSAITVAPAEAEAAVTYISVWWPKTWPPLLTTTGLLTGTGFALAFALMTVFFFLNWFGVKLLGAVTHGAGWWKLVIPFVTVALIFAFIFHFNNFHLVFTSPVSGVPSAKGFIAYGWAPVFFALPTTGIVFAYLGFRQGLEFGGEAKNPQRTVPLGTILGFIIAIVLYVLLQSSFIGGIDWSRLVYQAQVYSFTKPYTFPNGTTRNITFTFYEFVPLAPGNWSGLSVALLNTSKTYFYPYYFTANASLGLSSYNLSNVVLHTPYGNVSVDALTFLNVSQAPSLTPLSSGPFYSLLAVSGIGFLLGWAVILLIDAVVSPSGTGWIYEGTTARVLYGMAADGVIPDWFLRLNKYKIPWISLIASWLIGAIFMLPYPAWAKIATFISTTTVLTYIVGGSTLMVLRRTAPNMPRPFRLGSDAVAWIMSAIAFIASFLIVYWSMFSSLWLTIVFILIGVSLYYMMVAPARFGAKRSHGIAAGIIYWIILGLTTYMVYKPIGYYMMISETVPLNAYNMGILVAFVAINLAAIVGLTEWLKREMNEEGKAHTNAGYWVVGLIFSAYVLSFLGQYGPFPKPIIPFPYDTVLAAVVALVFFVYSVYSGIFTRDLEAVLREVGVTPAAPPAGSPATVGAPGAPMAASGQPKGSQK